MQKSVALQAKANEWVSEDPRGLSLEQNPDSAPWGSPGAASHPGPVPGPPDVTWMRAGRGLLEGLSPGQLPAEMLTSPAPRHRPLPCWGPDLGRAGGSFCREFSASRAVSNLVTSGTGDRSPQPRRRPASSRPPRPLPVPEPRGSCPCRDQHPVGRLMSSALLDAQACLLFPLKRHFV